MGFHIMKKIVLVIEIDEIYDQDSYIKYIQQVVEIIKHYKGEYIARSEKIYSMVGERPKRCIIIGFESKEDADMCFSSDEYVKIKHLRENSTKSKAFFVEND